MIIAILADVHANNFALDAVRHKCDTLNVDKYWFLGDIVGRGPEPLYSINWILKDIHASDDNSWLIGNHDAMMVNLLPKYVMDNISNDAKLVIEEHANRLQSDKYVWDFVTTNFTQRRTQPRRQDFIETSHILTHGGLDDFPDYRYSYPWMSMDYFTKEFSGLQNYCRNKTAILWFGHTHIPTLISAEIIDLEIKITIHKIIPRRRYILVPDRYWLINPGSVGQPRDLDSRSSFAVFNTNTLEVYFERVEYDLQEVAHMMVLKNYPKKFIMRLLTASSKNPPPEWANHFSITKDMR